MEPYAEKTGDGQVGIHCDIETADLIHEALCNSYAQYPCPCPEEWQEEKRKLGKLINDIEGLLPRFS